MTPHPGGPRLHAPRTPDRWPRMPVRRSRTPVRRTRGLDDTRVSTCSRSPIRRSSSSDSPPRDASPVNFSAALDSEDKVKDRSITDDEAEDGAQKKVSAAQYQLLWQAVTTSKGSFKVNPAKSRRAPRVSLLELGDSEVTDQVSWLDQPSLKDTMASTAHIAQGLKEDEEVEKTLSETLNTSSSTFKHLTVKQIFPREPYRLKVHRDAQYVPKPPGDSGFSDSKASSSYQISHPMCLHTEELARRSAIYASLADSMVASVIEELSPKDERTKLLREKLAIIQEAQVSAVSAGFAAASNLQLLRRDALLKNFGFQPQVLSTMRTAQFEGSHVLGPEPKVLQNRVRTIRQADRMAGSSVTFAQKHREAKSSTKVTSSKKTASWTSVFNRLGSPTATTIQRTVTQESPFHAGAGRGARHRPYPDSCKKPGKSSVASSTRPPWWVPNGGSPGRLCSALAESAGQLSGHRHCRRLGGHCIPATTSAHPLVHQLPCQKQPAGPPASHRCLAAEGSHRAGHQRDTPRVLQPVVPDPKEDKRSATCDQSLHSPPPHGSSTLQDEDARVRPFSPQKSGSGQIDRPSCSDAPGRPQVSTFRGQQESVPVHLSPLRIGDFSTRVHQAAARRSADKAARCEATCLLRRLADQSRYSGTGQLHAQTTIRVLQFLGWIINYEKSDLTPSQNFQFIGMQFNTGQFTVAPLPKMRLKVQSVHQHWMTDPNITARDLHRLLGMLVFTASLVRRGRLRLCLVQWWAATAWCQRTGSWSDRITVPQWVLSEVAWWASPAVLQGLPLAAKETEVTLFTDASSSGWGAQLGSRSTRGQWSASPKIVAHKLSGDAGCHQRCERLPASSEVPGGSLDVRQRSDCGLHHWSSDATARRLHWFPSICQECTTWCVHDGHGASTTGVCQVVRATGWLVGDIRQQMTHQVYFDVSGPQGRVDRCHVHAVGQREGPSVRVPAIQDGPSSSAEDRSVTRSQGDFDRSTATVSVVVSRVDGSVPRRSDPAVHRRLRPADSRRLDRRQGDRDSSLPAIKSTRVETQRAILWAKGHSREAANMMSRCLRESSLQVYESHWSRFVAFCRSKRWHVFRVRSHHFSTYMMHLFREGLLPSTIISHLTSVASVLRHWVYDPAADPHIKLLIRAFRLERPVQCRIMPKWDLHLVLLSLLRPPFASDGEVDGNPQMTSFP